MPLSDLPSVEQVRSLPCYLRRTVPSEYLDQNGHMNIQHYLNLYDQAGATFFESIGVTMAYFTERKLGMFDLEHHLSYLAECHAGDEVAVHARAVARTPKRMHGVWFLVNESTDALSNVFEFVSSHADLAARKTSPFPDDIARKIDAMVAADQALAWPAPLCGIMGA